MNVEAGSELTAEVKGRALGLGFARVGIAAIAALPREAAALRRWLADGHHGSMNYMERTQEVRCDPRHPGMLPSARCVVVVAAPYGGAEEAAVNVAEGGRIARYAQGRDYHRVLDKRLRKLAAWLRQGGHAARVAVDRLPLLERAWAQRAGLGFVGKNACLIVPGLGSHLFLGAVVTSADLQTDKPMVERCGSCRLCLDACPTQALIDDRQLDARRCIAYLTIEHRGSIDEELRSGMQDWLFGCDLCQDVCPYNHGSGAAEADASMFAAQPAWKSLNVMDWLQLDDAAFAELTQGSALRRAGAESMARNAAIALGNRGDKRHLPVLRQAAQNHPAAVVREAASWAHERVMIANVPPPPPPSARLPAERPAETAPARSAPAP